MFFNMIWFGFKCVMICNLNIKKENQNRSSNTDKKSTQRARCLNLLYICSILIKIETIVKT